MFTNTRHTGLVVNDLKKAQQFYQELGFELVSTDIESGYFIEQVTGIEGSKLEWVKLSLGDGVLLELLHYHVPGNVYFREVCQSGDKLLPEHCYPSNMHGCSHIAYSTDDIEACCEKITSMGGRVVNKPALAPNGKVKVAYSYDLDGILMEIVEELSHG
ncbi:MAG: VOC family protein [Aestuariibacter sp.]